MTRRSCRRTPRPAINWRNSPASMIPISAAATRSLRAIYRWCRAYCRRPRRLSSPCPRRPQPRRSLPSRSHREWHKPAYSSGCGDSCSAAARPRRRPARMPRRQRPRPSAIDPRIAIDTAMTAIATGRTATVSATCAATDRAIRAVIAHAANLDRAGPMPRLRRSAAAIRAARHRAPISRRARKPRLARTRVRGPMLARVRSHQPVAKAANAVAVAAVGAAEGAVTAPRIQPMVPTQPRAARPRMAQLQTAPARRPHPTRPPHPPRAPHPPDPPRAPHRPRVAWKAHRGMCRRRPESPRNPRAPVMTISTWCGLPRRARLSAPDLRRGKQGAL
jgi:hypothetical protein